MRPNTEFGPLIKRRPVWCSDALFNRFPAHDPMDPDLLIKAAEVFENDAAAEYDARHLTDQLAAWLQDWPKEIGSFMQLWGFDEDNHYRGLRYLLHVVTDEPEELIHHRMKQRQPDFSGIDPYIDDPFHFLVALAYDECVTVQAYAMDYSLYDALGAGAGRWVRLTNRDEASHYANAVRLIRHLYPDRTTEVPKLLDRLVAHDQERKPYRATFLLDHDYPQIYFSPDRLQRSARRVAKAICR